MKLIIKNKEYVLSPEDVAESKKAFRQFLNAFRKKSVRENKNALYLTLLLVSYLKSKELIESISEDNLQVLLRILNSEEV